MRAEPEVGLWKIGDWSIVVAWKDINLHWLATIGRDTTIIL